MRDVVDLVVTQVTDGEIRWEDWWLRRHGKVRHQIPTFDDYLGFIDFDLANNSLPRLRRDGERIVLKRVPLATVAAVQRIVEYHGFRAEPLI
ncbi:hypothetical protein ACLQ3H_16045 [Micromonospora saelicesensis]|uniref:hypothetical protein n=1 Tax=Micromonospora saelicesensis TaxID=285676 RepID=UPI003CF31FE0